MSAANAPRASEVIEELNRIRAEQSAADFRARHFCNCAHPIPDRVMMGERERRACRRFIAPLARGGRR